MPRAWQIFFDLQLLPLIFFQPPYLQEHTVLHMKDLIHICLETESQGYGMTFNMIYDRSNLPSFHIIQRPLLKQKLPAL